MNHTKHLHFLGASHDMVRWAEKHTTSFADLWEKCHRADWMLWIDRRTNLLDNHTRRLLACAFVRHTPLGDGGFVWDNADVTARDAAWSAAWLAARDAERSAERSPATSDEEAAQRDAKRSVVWAAAWSSAWGAAWDAARTATKGGAWEAARGAALRASNEAQADIIRVIAGNPFLTTTGAGHDGGGAIAQFKPNHCNENRYSPLPDINDYYNRLKVRQIRGEHTPYTSERWSVEGNRWYIDMAPHWNP